MKWLVDLSHESYLGHVEKSSFFFFFFLENMNQKAPMESYIPVLIVEKNCIDDQWMELQEMEGYSALLYICLHFKQGHPH